MGHKTICRRKKKHICQTRHINSQSQSKIQKHTQVKWSPHKTNLIYAKHKTLSLEYKLRKYNSPTCRKGSKVVTLTGFSKLWIGELGKHSKLLHKKWEKLQVYFSIASQNGREEDGVRKRCMHIAFKTANRVLDFVKHNRYTNICRLAPACW